MEPEQSAHALWIGTEELFHNNMESWEIFLDAEFHNLVQGELSITAYYQKIKTLADALRDVSQPVSDRTMVHNTICGLNPRFSNAASIILLKTMFPSFVRACSMLLLGELRFDNTAKVNAATALYSGTIAQQSSCTDSSCQTDCGNQNHGGKNFSKNKGKKGGNNNTRQYTCTPFNPHAPPAPARPWVCFSPWSGQGQ